MNKKSIIALIALVLLVALVVGIYAATRPNTGSDENGTSQTGTETEPSQEGGESVKPGKTFALTVVHGDKTEKTFTVTSEQKYLSLALIDEGIINDEGLQTGMYFTVDGETASWEQNQSYWAVYIGEEFANYGMNDIPVEEGGVYSLVYTIG